MTARITGVEVAVQTDAELGESPVWDERSWALLWVDIEGRVLHIHRPDTGSDETIEVGKRLGAVSLRQNGGLALSVEDGVELLTEEGEKEALIPIEADRADTRLNDAKPDPAGRLWVGSLALDLAEGAGSLYRVDPDQTTTVMVEGVTISNGLAWSLDAKVMYYIDSSTGGIDRYDYDIDKGRTSNREVLVTFPEGDGVPDGMAIDQEGCLWVAAFSGSEIRRITPAGALDAVIPLPVSRPTSVCFGGPEFEVLYITTAREGLDREALEREPLAGSVFACQTGWSGQPADRFAG